MFEDKQKAPFRQSGSDIYHQASEVNLWNDSQNKTEVPDQYEDDARQGIALSSSS
jgi:hypothetical protein